MKGRPFTRHDLWLAVLTKARRLPPEFGPDGGTAEQMADAIRIHGLEEAIVGRHDGRPIKAAAAYELVFGERLTLKRSA